MILNPEPDDFFYGADDHEQASLDAAAQVHRSRMSRVQRHRQAGNLDRAAAACGHDGSGYPLQSIAARRAHDPRAGESGFRCSNCGSHLGCDPWEAAKWDRRPTVLHPCEID